jgi:GT2 family glycosyltransferase
MAATNPTAAVVIITWNRRHEVLRTLRRLDGPAERPPIIVVDNCSTDGTSEAIAQEFPAAKVVRAKRNMGAAARNLGVEAADAPYIAFCDDDMWWQAGSIGHAVRIFEQQPTIALLMGRVLVGPEEEEDPICQQIVGGPLPYEKGMPGYPLIGFLCGASIVRRSAYLEAGGVRSDLGIGGEEDWLAVELLMRGWRLRYVPELCCYHHPSMQRNRLQRRRRDLANALCFAWLRGPAGSAWRKTLQLVKTSPWDVTTLWALSAASARIVRQWRHRRVVSDEIERSYRLLESRQKTAQPQYVAEPLSDAVRS